MSRELLPVMQTICVTEESPKMEPQVFECTAREIRTRLATMPDDERVRVMVGRPSLAVIVRKLQGTAAANGMTDAIHDTLLQCLKHDR
jgi:hypothetical protein